MTDVLPVAELVHAIAGRARLRIVRRRGDGVFFAAMASGLSTIPGVREVDVRPLTGSILVQHDASLEDIGAAARAARLFVLDDARSVTSPAPAAPLDPGTVIGLGLGAVAVWQLLQGRILPPAITLAWYAATLTGLLSQADKPTPAGFQPAWRAALSPAHDAARRPRSA